MAPSVKRDILTAVQNNNVAAQWRIDFVVLFEAFGSFQMRLQLFSLYSNRSIPLFEIEGVQVSGFSADT
jgi:hypothetical protein